jgi:deazaflavin-dependent oxidoreductase (nitroreductase family)
VSRISGSARFAKLAPSIITPLDKAVFRLTKGKRMLSQGLVPTLVLTATGAKSGEPRVVPLACFPKDDAIYLVGSNFGREHHPAWTANLRKHPDATVAFEGEQFAVRAHLLSAEEKAAVWPWLTTEWPNYDVYTERSGRDLRVFRLERLPSA